MKSTFVTRKFGNVERNSHCDVIHITPIRVARLFLDCNGDFVIRPYCFKGAIPMVSLNVISFTFPHCSHSMLTTMVMCHNFMLEKHIYYTMSMLQLIRIFMCR